MSEKEDKSPTSDHEYLPDVTPDPLGLLTQPNLTPEEETRAWRRIDIRLMPILTLIYIFSSIDRGNIGLAKIQGLTQQLELTGNKFNIALMMFFIPYTLLQFPSNLVLKKFRPSRWIPGLTITWGIVMMAMGFVKTYQQLVGVRICLAVAEAGMLPGVIYYLTLWYPRHKLQYRVGLFFGASSLSGAFSGLLAYGISFMSGIDGRLGWSWIFIIEGCATIAVGILALLVMVDFPSDAKFLTPKEKEFVVWSKKYGATTVGEEEHFEVRHITMAVTDWQLWFHTLLACSIACPMYGISYFLPSIIRGFGYSSTISSLLTVPPYVVSTIVLLFFAHYSDKLRLRWPFIFSGLLMSAVGFIINISDAPRGVKYFGTFLCVTGFYSIIPGVMAWYGGNLVGHYKRASALALYVSVGNVPGMIASNIYRSQDAPRYILGHAVGLGFVGMGLVLVPTIVFIYKRVNARREAIMKGAVESGGLKYTNEELRRMGDKAPNFRYGI